VRPHLTPQGTRLNLRPVGIAVFFITVAGFVRSPLLPDMGRELNMGPAALGTFVAVFALGRILADVPAGRLTDTRPARAMLAVAAALAGLGSLVTGVAPVSALVFVGAFVVGVGSAWTNTTGIAAFAEAPRERRGVAMSGFAAALMVGQAVGPAFGGAVASLSDWRVALLTASGLAAAVAISLAWPRRVQPAIRTVSRDDNDGGSIARPVLLALYLLPAVQFGIGGALIQTLVPIVGDAELGLTVGTVGAAIGVGGLLRLVGALASGKISDTHSRRWALLPGLVIQLIGLVVFAVWDTLAAWWLAIVLTSLGSSGVMVGATILADLSEGGRLGRRLGVFRVSGDAALLVAPLVGGVLYEISGRGLALLPLVAFVAVVIVLNALVVPETQGRAGSE
jgi:MFS transporter, DHA1 family, multidrug resistance protein